MVNTKGGKGYKKGRNTELDLKGFEVKYEDGQMIGRVIKSLGNRRFRIYCNDNKERICKLAGSMRKSQWVDEGSLVLLSVRNMGTGFSTDQHDKDIGDILMVIPNSFISKLKKDSQANPMVFANIDEQNVKEIKRKVADGETLEEDDLFEGNSSDEEETCDKDKDKDQNKEQPSDTDSDDHPVTVVDKEAKEKEVARKKKEKSKERDQKRAGGRDAKRVQESDEVDIDAI